MTISHRLPRVALVVSALAVSMAAVAVPANAAPAEVNGAAEASGWITYRSKAPAGTPTTIVKGQRAANGACLLSGSGELQPGYAAVETHELAFNLSTCESKMAIVYLTEAEYAARMAEEALEEGRSEQVESVESVESTPAKTTGEPQESGDVGIMGYAAGFSKSYYEDPPGLDVNVVRNSTNWYYNGSCVTSAGGTYTYNWLSASGWSKLSSNWRNIYSCYQSESSSYAHYFNGIFCAGNDTHTYYDRNKVHGRYNGSLGWSWYAWKSGGCTSLLSFHHVAGFVA